MNKFVFVIGFILFSFGCHAGCRTKSHLPPGLELQEEVVSDASCGFEHGDASQD